MCHQVVDTIRIVYFGSVRGSPNCTIGNFTNGTIGYPRYRVVSPVSRFAPESFRPGLFRPGSFRPIRNSSIGGLAYLLLIVMS